MDDAITWLEERPEVDNLALFSDFDGTLAPIVERPDEARPLAAIPRLLAEIGTVIPVAVISGRGLEDVTSRLGASDIYYAGSHGLELATPGGDRVISEHVEALVPRVDDYERSLRSRFSEVPRIEIERKRFSVAVHFRRRPEAREIVEKAIEKLIEDAGEFEMGTGKMVRELQPDVDRDKGTALRSIRQKVDARHRKTPLYLGDDTTDEDAFRAVADDGVGILVAEHPRESAAGLWLRNPEAVRDFLGLLHRRLDREANRG